MSLLGDIKKRPVAYERRGAKSWHVEMREQNGKLYSELLEVCWDWIEGGTTRKKFPTLAALHRYLAGEDGGKMDPPVVTCSYMSFRAFIQKIQNV